MLGRCAFRVNIMQSEGVAVALKSACERVQSAIKKTGRDKPVEFSLWLPQPGSAWHHFPQSRCNSTLSVFAAPISRCEQDKASRDAQRGIRRWPSGLWGKLCSGFSPCCSDILQSQGYVYL